MTDREQRKDETFTDCGDGIGSHGCRHPDRCGQDGFYGCKEPITSWTVERALSSLAGRVITVYGLAALTGRTYEDMHLALHERKIKVHPNDDSVKVSDLLDTRPPEVRFIVGTLADKWFGPETESTPAKGQRPSQGFRQGTNGTGREASEE